MTKIQRSNFIQQNANKHDLSEVESKLANDPASAADMHEAGLDFGRIRQAERNQDGMLDPREGDSKFKVGNTVYDLATDDGRKGFVATLGLPADQSSEIDDVFAKAGQGYWGDGNKDGLDELAGIAQVWAKGEKGEKGEDIPLRADATAKIQQFQQSMANNPAPSAEASQALNLLNGLRNLDSGVIPQTWI